LKSTKRNFLQRVKTAATISSQPVNKIKNTLRNKIQEYLVVHISVIVN